MNKYKQTLKIVFFTILVLFGIFAFFYGGYDDSPGAQLLGLVIAITATLFLLKKKKNFKVTKKFDKNS